MGTVLAVSNQKGGVGKTTSSVSLAAELADRQNKVLLIDIDPQGNATSGLGLGRYEGGTEPTLFDVFFGRASLSDILKSTEIVGLDVAPSARELISVETELGKTPGRELILRSEIRLLRDSYRYIIIDCPPASGLLSLNALGASELVLIPLQAEYYALEGVSALVSTLQFVKETFNPALDVLGVFLTMFDSRTKLSTQVEAEARAYFGELMCRTVIPRNIRLSEAPSHGMPISLYDPVSAGAVAYRELAQELANRIEVLKSGEPREEERADLNSQQFASHETEGGEGGQTEEEQVSDKEVVHG